MNDRITSTSSFRKRKKKNTDNTPRKTSFSGGRRRLDKVITGRVGPTPSTLIIAGIPGEGGSGGRARYGSSVDDSPPFPDRGTHTGQSSIAPHACTVFALLSSTNGSRARYFRHFRYSTTDAFRPKYSPTTVECASPIGFVNAARNDKPEDVLTGTNTGKKRTVYRTRSGRVRASTPGEFVITVRSMWGRPRSGAVFKRARYVFL